MKRYLPDAVWIEARERETPIVRTLLSRLGDRPVHWFDGRGEEPGDFAGGKRELVLCRHRGSFLRHCPAGTAGLVCCSYLVLNLVSNCPMDCSYCFLQEYLANNPRLKVYTNPEDALTEVDAVLRARPERSFRIGTGELGDSLALDPLTGLSRQLVPFFAARTNATLELKTKTDAVDELLSLDPNGRVVVSWSVNAPRIVSSEEPGTASLEERVRAAGRVEAGGYRLGFHFDPLIEHDGWEEGYRIAVETIFRSIDSSSVAWVSLGSMRLTATLTQAIRSRRDSPRVLGAELVPSGDGKARVWRGLRLRMYRHLIGELRRVDPRLPIYLCMESARVWEQVMGDVPSDRELGIRLAAGAAW